MLALYPSGVGSMPTLASIFLILRKLVHHYFCAYVHIRLGTNGGNINMIYGFDSKVGFYEAQIVPLKANDKTSGFLYGLSRQNSLSPCFVSEEDFLNLYNNATVIFEDYDVVPYGISLRTASLKETDAWPEAVKEWITRYPIIGDLNIGPEEYSPDFFFAKAIDLPKLVDNLTRPQMGYYAKKVLGALAEEGGYRGGLGMLQEMFDDSKQTIDILIGGLAGLLRNS